MFRLLTISLSLLFFIPAMGQKHLKKEIEKIIYNDTNVKLSDHPNILIGLIDNGKRYMVQFSTEEAIDTLSIFEIGSVTKPIISGYISYLEKNNVLNKKDEIVKYIPELNGSSIAYANIQELLNGNVDFPRFPKNLGIYEKNIGDPYQYYQKEDLIDYIFDNNFKITKSAFYSHIGYALLEYIIEAATEKNYVEAINDYITKVLKLEHTGSDQDLTPGHRRNGNPSTPRNYATFAPSEGLSSNVSDLLDFLEHQMNHDGELEFLSSTMEHQKKSNLGKDIYQSEGWMVYKKYAKSDLYVFSGKSDGHSAEVCFLPATKTGVVILDNSSFGTQNLPYLILRMMNNQWKRKADE